nr:hypothetical protein [Tanacetum cinerariifolium]
EAATFVGDFKSLANEADESLAKYKALEWEIERLLKAVVSQDIMNIMQKESIVDTSYLQTELKRTKERFKNCIIKKENEYAILWNDCYVNGKNSHGKKQKAKVSLKENQKKYQPKVKKPKKVGFIERLATPKRRKPRFLLRWSPTGRLFDQKGKIVDSSEFESQSDCSNGDNACTSNTLEPKIKRFPNSTSLLGGLSRFVCGLPKFKYHKEHLYPSCEQGKSKRASHPPKLVLNSRKRLHLLYMDLCGPIRIASINGKRYVLVIVDDYSYYTWTLVEAARTIFIFSRAPLLLWAGAIATACFTQNRSITHRRFNKTPYELINGRKSDILFLHVFGALCYLMNDHEDIGKLGAKGDIGFFIGYSADSFTYRIYNQRTKKIMETMNVLFDELLAMAFEQRSLKPGLQSMTSGQISSGLDLNYAPSTITTQQPTEEPKNVKEAMTDLAWIDSMQEELLRFKRLDVLVLVPAPDYISPLTMKWLFKNKHDEEQTVIRNKSRLVVRGYRQEEGIDFKESFAPALYGLKQAPRAWYDELSTFLLQNHFFNGTIDPTLFIRRFHDDILVVQVYVDDIIFGSTHPSGAQFLGEKLVSWSVKKQDCTTLSTTKVEYVSLSACSIAISCNSVQHSRTKHIAVCYYFIKEHVEKGTIELYFVKTDYQLADLFTKALPADRFNYPVRRLGMRSLSPQELEHLAKSQ